MRLQFIVYGNPIPWRRARRKGSQYFTHPDVEEWQAEAIAAFLVERDRAGEAQGLPCWEEEDLVLSLKFYRGDRRKVDLDNLEKSIMDALGGWRDRPGYVWKDDSQIKKKISELSYDKKNPRVEIEVWERG